jgi:hypothetical protein
MKDTVDQMVRQFTNEHWSKAREIFQASLKVPRLDTKSDSTQPQTSQAPDPSPEIDSEASNSRQPDADTHDEVRTRYLSILRTMLTHVQADPTQERDRLDRTPPPFRHRQL